MSLVHQLKTILRSNLFDEYSSIVKPREDLLMFDTTFVEIDLVVDKILEVSQTGEFMSAKMVMKQRWVDNRLVWFSNFSGTKSMATVMLVTKMLCSNFE